MKKLMAPALAALLVGICGLTIVQAQTVTCAQLPALTGDVTTPGASCATTIASGVVTSGKMASGAAIGNIGYTPLPTANPAFTGTLSGSTVTITDGLGDNYTIARNSPNGLLRFAPAQNGFTGYEFQVKDSGGVTSIPFWVDTSGIHAGTTNGAIQKGNSGGGFATASPCTDYLAPSCSTPYRPEWYSNNIATASTAANANSASGYGGSIMFTNAYTLGNSFTIPSGQVWDGSAAGRAPFSYTPTTGSAITVLGDVGALRSAWVKQVGTPTSTTGVQVGAGENGQQTVVRDVTVDLFNTGIDMNSNVARVLQNVFSRGSLNYGIRTRNTFNADAGDDFWSGVTIDPGVPGQGENVRFEGGGGLKVVGLKSLGSQIGFHVSMPDGAATQDLQFGTSSIENATIACMKFDRSGTTGFFGLVTIVNSEFAGCPIGNWFANAGVTTAFVGGNAYANVASTAIRLDNGANNVVIGPNVYSTVTPIIDNRNDFNEDGYIDRDTVHSFINVGTTNTNVFEVAVPPFRAARIHIFIEGIAQGNGAFAISKDLIAVNNNANLAITSINNTPAGVPAIAVNTDTTTTSGTVYLGINLVPGQGTSLAGTFTIKTEGKVKQITLH